MANFLVGCDIGTSGAKAILINEDGTVLSSSYLEYKIYTPRPGWVEHHTEDYWRVFCDCVKKVIVESKVESKDIKGVSVSANSPGCILVDEKLNALQNCHIWLDRRATKECDSVRNILGDDAVFDLSANSLDPHSGTIKLLWEKENRNNLYKKAYKMLNPSNYVTMKLTDRAVCDYSNASLIGIVFDIRKRIWNTDYIERIGLDAGKFPDLFPCDEIIGEVTKAASEACGLAQGTPVVAGSVDCNAAWLGNGAVDSGDAAMVMGTAGAFGVVHKTPNFTRSLTTIIHTANSREQYTTLAGTSACGNLLRYFRDVFGQSEIAQAANDETCAYDLLTKQAEGIVAGSDGLIVLPYLSGERTPIWNPLARGVIFGMSMSHKKGHYIRAFMESAIFAIYHCVKIMKANGVKIHEPVLVSEGGACSFLWRQIACDILNIELEYMSDAKGAPMGNAINAGVGVGIYKDYSIAKQLIDIDMKHIPNKKDHAHYEALFEIYLKLYNDIKENYELIAKVTGYQ